MARNGNPGALAGATGAGLPRSAIAAGAPNLAQAEVRDQRGGTYRVMPEGGAPFEICVKGREAWALDRLRAAGPTGCTPIDEPAPRWSAYIHRLRGRGVPIETRHEPHGGAFAGHHARYVLGAAVRKGDAT